VTNTIICHREISKLLKLLKLLKKWGNGNLKLF